MPTLRELQAQASDPVNKAKALEAALQILRFHTVFNTEYHLVEDKIIEAEDAIDEIDANPDGVDQAARADLSEFVLEQQGRLNLLDAKLRAFEASDLNIKPPTKQMVEQVKKETARVAALLAKDGALAAIIKGLTEIAQIADNSGKPHP